VSAQTVLRMEHGRMDRMTLRSTRAVAAALGIELHLVPRSIRGGAIDRQIDRRHAALVDQLLALLAVAGWEVSTEYSFNRFGDRGCVDVLAWYPDRRALLVVEVKSELRDVQETLRALDIKRRVVPGRVAVDKGWKAASVGVVLAMSDIRAERDRVGRHKATFAAALPARTVEVKRWVSMPEAPLNGIWFLQIPRDELLKPRTRTGERVRRSREPIGVPARAEDGPDEGPTEPIRRLLANAARSEAGSIRR
jgi:hypothetical protein